MGVANRDERPFPRGRAGNFPHLLSGRVSHPAGALRRWEVAGDGENGTPFSDRGRFTPKLRTSRVFVRLFGDKTRDKTPFVAWRRISKSLAFSDEPREPG